MRSDQRQADSKKCIRLGPLTEASAPSEWRGEAARLSGAQLYSPAIHRANDGAHRGRLLRPDVFQNVARPDRFVLGGATPNFFRKPYGPGVSFLLHRCPQSA